MCRWCNLVFLLYWVWLVYTQFGNAWMKCYVRMWLYLPYSSKQKLWWLYNSTIRVMWYLCWCCHIHSTMSGFVVKYGAFNPLLKVFPYDIDESKHESCFRFTPGNTISFSNILWYQILLHHNTTLSQEIEPKRLSIVLSPLIWNILFKWSFRYMKLYPRDTLQLLSQICKNNDHAQYKYAKAHMTFNGYIEKITWVQLIMRYEEYYIVRNYNHHTHHSKVLYLIWIVQSQRMRYNDCSLSYKTYNVTNST